MCIRDSIEEIQKNLQTVEQFQYAKKQMRQLLLTIKAMKSSAERSLQVCIISVSYTHLDVYKRQGMLTAKLFLSALNVT